MKKTFLPKLLTPSLTIHLLVEQIFVINLVPPFTEPGADTYVMEPTIYVHDVCNRMSVFALSKGFTPLIRFSSD